MAKTTSKKIRRKLVSLIKKTIPYRSHWRPLGIYTPQEAHSIFQNESSCYKLVYSNYQTELPVFQDFFSKVAPYTIYDPYEIKLNGEVLIKHHCDYGVLKIPDGRILSNNLDFISVMTRDNHLIDNVSYQYKVDSGTTARDNSIFHQRFFSEPEYIDGTVFSMLAGHGATHNIAHWFFDAIPRLHLLQESGFFDEVDYFLVPSYQYDYHKDSLLPFGIDEKKIIKGDDDTHLIAKNLIVSSHPRGNRSFLLPQWLSEFLRKSYLNEEVKDPTSPKKIYISRKDSKLRQVENEDELIETLEKHGFESVMLSKYPFKEKIKLFYNAEVIVSSSGAGLTSLFFSQKGSTVVELFSEGFVHTHFYNIAYHAGMEYYSLICKSPKPAKDMKGGQLEDIYVNMDEMNIILGKIF